jgi:hypothetical protein
MSTGAPGVVEPLWNHWWIHTHVEDVSEKELMRPAGSSGA